MMPWLMAAIYIIVGVLFGASFRRYEWEEGLDPDNGAMITGIILWLPLLVGLTIYTLFDKWREREPIKQKLLRLKNRWNRKQEDKAPYKWWEVYQERHINDFYNIRRGEEVIPAEENLFGADIIGDHDFDFNIPEPDVFFDDPEEDRDWDQIFDIAYDEIRARERRIGGGDVVWHGNVEDVRDAMEALKNRGAKEETDPEDFQPF